MGALTDDNVALLVLDLAHQLGQFLDLNLERVLGRVGLGDVDDAVDVERDFFAVGAPVLVAEAVGVLAVVLGFKGEITG